MFSICFAFDPCITNNISKILSVYRFFRNVSKVIYSTFFVILNCSVQFLKIPAPTAIKNLHFKMKASFSNIFQVEYFLSVAKILNKIFSSIFLLTVFLYKKACIFNTTYRMSAMGTHLKVALQGCSGRSLDVIRYLCLCLCV